MRLNPIENPPNLLVKLAFESDLCEKAEIDVVGE